MPRRSPRRWPPARPPTPDAVVMSVEQARLEMELASQIRTKVTDSINTLMQTQV